MSTLKVNNIESYTGTSPISINDSVVFSGSLGNPNQNYIPAGINGAFAHGQGNSASADLAHAEGLYTTADKTGAHSEGSQTLAGAYAHAEGWATSASGLYSHAEGYQTTASHQGSHAEGQSTKTGANYQHVSGKFNRTNANALTVIGNGISTSATSNIVEVYTGQMTLSGSLYIKSGSNTVVQINTLPTSDPSVAGQLFTTQSAGTGGNLDGQLVLLVSQG